MRATTLSKYTSNGFSCLYPSHMKVKHEYPNFGCIFKGRQFKSMKVAVISEETYGGLFDLYWRSKNLPTDRITKNYFTTLKYGDTVFERLISLEEFITVEKKWYNLLYLTEYKNYFHFIEIMCAGDYYQDENLWMEVQDSFKFIYPKASTKKSN